MSWHLVYIWCAGQAQETELAMVREELDAAKTAAIDAAAQLHAAKDRAAAAEAEAARLHAAAEVATKVLQACSVTLRPKICQGT